ncbi:MAG: DUF104 domain-containing protein [Euryarchaeota archaeon]|nr:DUF104 domain-containing protein [Euryarchaeota archaeon]
MPISAVYRKGVIKPLIEVDLKENEEIEIEIKRKKSVVDELAGLIKAKPEIVDEVVENEELYEF